MKHRNTVLLVYMITLAGTLLLLGSILLAPYLKQIHSPWNSVLYSAFSPVCHQIESRCFFLFGFPLAVCTRCFGIYAGFLAGILTYSFIRGFTDLKMPKTIFFFLVSLPIAVDTTGNFWGLWSSPSWLRFIIGSIWGHILPYYLVTGVSEFLLHLKKRKENRSRH
ncbi:DUF2085 domain-containing protein [Acidobacteriota bacterium]